MENSVPVASRKSRYRNVISATQSSDLPKAAKLHASVVLEALGTDTTFLKKSYRSAPPESEKHSRHHLRQSVINNRFDCCQTEC